MRVRRALHLLFYSISVPQNYLNSFSFSAAQEYNGEVRPRYSLAGVRPTDYAAESRRLLGLLAAPAAA